MTTEQTDRSLFHQTPGEPFAYLEDLRRNCPVYWDPLLRGHFITRFADVHEIMYNHDDFRLQARPEEQYADHQPKDRVRTFNGLLSKKVLVPRLDSVVQSEIDLLIDGFAAAGRCELHDDFAEKLPAHVIGTLFGLDRADFPTLLAYRRARSALFNAPPDATEIAVAAAAAQAVMHERMVEVIADHRAQPRDNVLSLLLGLSEDGAPIPDDEIMNIVVRDLLMAGSETVTSSVCNAVYRLLTVPGVLDRLVADPALVPAFVEESLRYDPPVHIFWRAPNRDVEVAGCPIGKDQQIYTSIAGANRDPEVFPEPGTFDLDRPKGQHITFSVGLHKCPGAFLGRSEVELTLATLLRRLPGVRLDPAAVPPDLTGVVLRNWNPLHLLFDPS
jgi:cytochrome P450